MRAVVIWSATAAAVTAIGLACAACSLTTDLSGFSDGVDPSEAGNVNPEGGAGPDGSSSGALPDAADANVDLSAQYAAVVLADSPVAYYRFEEPEDANAAKDSVGTHPATSTTDGVKFGAPGVRGKGATFDGTEASLDVGDFFDFSGLSPFTLELWVRSNKGVTTGLLIDKRHEALDPFKGYILYAQEEDGSPHFEAWGVELTAWGTTPLSVSAFSHVVVTVTYENGKGNAKLYVNAQPTANGGYDNTIALADTPQHLHFGKAFSGVLDEIAIYDKSLPAERILEHYRAGR